MKNLELLDTIFCPYPGLRPFRSEEAILFFGRDEQVDQLLAKLDRSRFLAVVGTSGCGKSSLVRAGLIPALKTGLLVSGGARWVVATMRPGEQPIRNLARALIDDGVVAGPAAGVEHTPEFLTAALRRGPLGLAEVLCDAPPPGQKKLLLLIDQFEEIFRFRREGGREEADAFVELLLASAAQEDVPIYVVLTMRSDFLGDCNLFAGLPEALNDSQFLTPRLTREERREAIEAPALVFDGRVDPALVNRLLNDMDAGPDQLPLMQHALMRLWTRARRANAPPSDVAPKPRGVTITLADYEAIGGLKLALSAHADEVFDRLDEGQRTIAEVLFRGLSERGAEGRDSRRPASLRSVAEAAGVPVEQVVPVVEAFRHADLSVLVPPPPTPLEPETILDISHESLIRQWQRLRAWAEAEASSAEMYRRLEKTASLWRTKRAGLWDTPDLDFALEWRVRERPNAAWARRYGGDFDGAMLFLSSSKKAQRRKLSAEQERRTAELETARRLAEAAEERRRVEEERAHDAERAATRLRRLVAALVAVAAVAVVLAVVAFIQRGQASRASLLADEQTKEARKQTEIALEASRKAKQQAEFADKAKKEAERQTGIAQAATEQANAVARIATSRQLAALSVADGDKRFDRSLLLAVEALRVENTFEARDSLYNALRGRPGLTSFLHIEAGTVHSVAFSPDGKTIAVGCDWGVELWDAATRKRLVDKPLFARGGGAISSVAFSPHGKTVAAGLTDRPTTPGGIMLWDAIAREGLVDEPLPVKEGWVHSVAFSPDGRTIAAGFQATGKGEGGGVVLWDAAAQNRLVDKPLPVEASWVNSMAFSPDGETIAVGFRLLDRGGVVLWDSVARKRLVDKPLPVEGEVHSVAFSPDGKTIAAGYGLLGDGGWVGGVVLWDAVARKRLADKPLSVEKGWVNSVAFSPDGKTLAAGFDRVVVLWDVAARNRLYERPLLVEEGWVNSVAFSPDGKTLAAGFDRFLGNDGGGVVLWDAAARKRVVDKPLPVEEGKVQSVVFSPDGKTIAAGFDGPHWGGVVLWDAVARKRVVDKPLPVEACWVKSVAFSPDGKTIAAGCGPAVVRQPPTDGLLVGGVPIPRSRRPQVSPFSSRQSEVDYTLKGGVVVWDAVTRKRLVDKPLPVEEGWVSSVAFSPDGKTIAAGFVSGQHRGGVVLWDSVARKRLVDKPLP
ncbi:MAG: AAA family ATPase, partial [Isosphaeraceae bacterium]